MSVTMQSLGIDRLPIDARLSLVCEILDSIVGVDERTGTSKSRLDLDELRRRVADDDANPEAVIPWDEVKDRALKRTQS